MSGYDASCWDGKVVEVRTGGDYRIELDNGRIVSACLSSELRMHYVKLLPDDMVVVEIEDGANIGKIIARLH